MVIKPLLQSRLYQIISMKHQQLHLVIAFSLVLYISLLLKHTYLVNNVLYLAEARKLSEYGIHSGMSL